MILAFEEFIRGSYELMGLLLRSHSEIVLSMNQKYNMEIELPNSQF